MLELGAVRVGPEDGDVVDAYWRVSELEGEPCDDATWESMLALAAKVVGDGTEHELKTNREWCSVQAWSGSIMVDVLWRGDFANVYYSNGADDEDRFQGVLQRLRDSGLTVVQGEEIREVGSTETVEELMAAQDG